MTAKRLCHPGHVPGFLFSPTLPIEVDIDFTMARRIPPLHLLLQNLQRSIERRPPYSRWPSLGRWLYEARMRLFPRDSLTGLLNRVKFSDRVNVSLAGGNAGALLVVDVDQLSWINYTWGHAKGDECLQHLAGLLVDAQRNGHIARFSGEEFVIYLEQGPEVEELAQRIRMRVEQDPRFEEMRARVPRRLSAAASEHGCYGPLLTLTVGVAHAKPGMPFDELLRASYGAMTSAKKAGRNRIAVAEVGAA